MVLAFAFVTLSEWLMFRPGFELCTSQIQVCGMHCVSQRVGAWGNISWWHVYKVWSCVEVTVCAKTVTGSVVIGWNMVCGDIASRITVTLTRDSILCDLSDVLILETPSCCDPLEEERLIHKDCSLPRNLEKKNSYLNASFRYDIQTCFKSMWMKQFQIQILARTLSAAELRAGCVRPALRRWLHHS